MNRIILYYTLKNDGNWMGIYKSLEEKRKIEYAKIDEVFSSIDCSYISIIDNEYPNSFKTIHKPPFGIFYFWNEKLLQKETITVIGEINNQNIDKIREIAKNKVLLWVNKDINEINKIIKQFKNNIFYVNHINNKDMTKQIETCDFEIQNNNLIVSEFHSIGQEESTDEMRFYIGISKNVLVVSDINEQYYNDILCYCKKEDCQVNYLKNND